MIHEDGRAEEEFVLSERHLRTLVGLVGQKLLVDRGLLYAFCIIPDFNSKMRDALIEVSRFDWSPISPAIFGSLFQSVMNKEERRRQGAHYTSEKNILKVVGPLFLDDLRSEFEHLKSLKIARKPRLSDFQEKLGRLKFLDPACGCGNFLVIAYRELRQLELEVLQTIFAGEDQLTLDVSALSKIDVDQFAGIEIGEFPSRIAETALWMMDHIMNSRLSLAFGKSYVRIPLKKSPVIKFDDALMLDWSTVLPADQCSYILGNPPFVGHQYRTDDQQAGMHNVWGRTGQVNRLDYVTSWFRKAADYMTKSSSVVTAFVATNSISQGEQASILWSWMYARGVHIHFAHRTFQWMSESRGKAAVHCVIVGFAKTKPASCTIFDYADIKGDPTPVSVPQINAYLINGPQIFVPTRSRAPAGFRSLFQGSKPADGARLRGKDGKLRTTSNLILKDDERQATLKRAPELKKWLKPYVGGDELISGNWRWCLWLKDAKLKDMKASTELQTRLQRVREGRLKSPTASVREFANYPWLFTQDRQPSTEYLAIPEVSSESREYIPISLLQPTVIGSNKLLLLPEAEPWLFALVTSAMHMGWMRTVSGRLESRYSYAPAVYNSFPWPNLSIADKARLDKSANTIINARAANTGLTLEEMYDPKSMPQNLRRAHQSNDKLVDRLYKTGGFVSERLRVEHLFQLFAKHASPIEAAAKPAAKGRSKKVN